VTTSLWFAFLRLSVCLRGYPSVDQLLKHRVIHVANEYTLILIHPLYEVGLYQLPGDEFKFVFRVTVKRGSSVGPTMSLYPA